jgi:hypothetical protein
MEPESKRGVIYYTFLTTIWLGKHTPVIPEIVPQPQLADGW